MRFQISSFLRISGSEFPILLLLAVWVPFTSLAADTGTITGTVDKPDLVGSVGAIARATSTENPNPKTGPGALDKATGRFTVDSLPLGADYDCVIAYGGARLEGVNFRVPRSDYEVEQPLSAEDVATIKSKARGMNSFENVVYILAVEGNIQNAVVVLNKLRTTPFYASKPHEIIWRLELWHFERPEETWVKIQDEWTVLYRERIQQSAYEKKAIVLDPALGGLRPTAETPRIDLGKIGLPEATPGVHMRVNKVERSKGDKP